jgi:hypothetical protein
MGSVAAMGGPVERFARLVVLVLTRASIILSACKYESRMDGSAMMYIFEITRSAFAKWRQVESHLTINQVNVF